MTCIASLELALRRLAPGRKSKRLRGLVPAIEQKLDEGITHGEILALLNDNGFELTERTYKSYLYRYRKRRRATGQPPATVTQPDQTRFQAADGAPAHTDMAPADPQQRPPTFDFDPKGIPELLK